MARAFVMARRIQNFSVVDVFCFFEWLWWCAYALIAATTSAFVPWCPRPDARNTVTIK